MSNSLYTPENLKKVNGAFKKGNTLTASAQNKRFAALNTQLSALKPLLPEVAKAKRLKEKVPVSFSVPFKQILSAVPVNTNRNKREFKKFQHTLLTFVNSGVSLR